MYVHTDMDTVANFHIRIRLYGVSGYAIFSYVWFCQTNHIYSPVTPIPIPKQGNTGVRTTHTTTPHLLAVWTASGIAADSIWGVPDVVHLRMSVAFLHNVWHVWHTLYLVGDGLICMGCTRSSPPAHECGIAAQCVTCMERHLNAVGDGENLQIYMGCIRYSPPAHECGIAAQCVTCMERHLNAVGGRKSADLYGVYQM